MDRVIERADDGQLLGLVARAKDGDNEAVAHLLASYRPLLLSSVGRLKRYLEGDILGGEDLEQEATKITIELIQEYRPANAAHFGSYLKQKLRWRLINYVRRERSRRSRSAHLDDGLCETIVEELRTVASPEIANPRLRSAIKQLSPKQRSVIFKLYWQDRTAEEVAAELNVTKESVRALSKRAEARIRRVVSSP